MWCIICGQPCEILRLARQPSNLSLFNSLHFLCVWRSMWRTSRAQQTTTTQPKSPAHRQITRSYRERRLKPKECSLPTRKDTGLLTLDKTSKGLELTGSLHVVCRREQRRQREMLLIKAHWYVEVQHMRLCWFWIDPWVDPWLFDSLGWWVRRPTMGNSRRGLDRFRHFVCEREREREVR